MGIAFADNMLDYDVSSVANFRTALAVKGSPVQGQSQANMIGSVAVAQAAAAVDPEQRSWINLGIGTATASLRGTETLLTVPIGDATKDFYISVRFRVTVAAAVARTLISPFAIIANQPSSPASSVPVVANVYAFIDKNLALHAGSSAIGEGGNGIVSNFNASDINQLEIYHKADGTVKMWLNEVPLTLPVATKTRPGTAYVHIVCYSDGGSASGTAPGATAFSVQFNDVISIDPSTAGLQYRPGKTGRVETVSLTADITKDWTADSSQANHYGVMNLPWRGTVPATEMLSAYAIGATERYQGAALRTDLGSLVYALILESQMSNTAGAAHTLDLKGSFNNAAETTLASYTYTAGAGNVYNRMVMDKNPNGNADWTLASATSPKIGYSIKS